MNSNKLTYTEAKRIAITDYLSSHGIEATRIRGNDYWYYSPFREERTPSFKVNAHLNVWYDHGTGEGGTILDLGARLHQCSVPEFLVMLTEGNNQPVLHQQQKVVPKLENKIEVLAVKLLTDKNLLHYIKSRAIDPDVAQSYCQEVEFKMGNRTYSAIGFPNNSGAYELRNSWFKGSSSPKDISLINNGNDKISVLEGFMDFLSLFQLTRPEIKHQVNNSDFLVLNSLSLLPRSAPLLQSYSHVNLFLDNDLAAAQAKQKQLASGIRFHDASTFYNGYKDVNEYLISLHKITLDQTIPKSRSKGMRR